MPIYKDKESQIPVTSIAAFFSAPICTSSTIPQDLLETLQQFLYFVDGNTSTVNPANLGLGVTPAAQLTKLYQNGFAPGGISVTGTITSGLTLVVADPSKISVGPLSAALYMVAMYHLTKQLQLITRGTITSNTLTGPNTTEIANRAIITDANQPVIYQVLKNVLLDNGFQLQTSATEKIAFNDLMMPNEPYGARPDNQGTSTIKGKLFTYMVNRTSANPPMDLLPNESHFKFKDPNVMNVYTTMSGSGAGTTALNTYLLNAVNAVIFKIFNEWNTQKDLVIQQLVQCLFNSILPGKDLPDGMILASGNGSQTQGILCRPNFGILFLEYDHAIQSFGSGRLTTTVTGQKVRSFKTPAAGARTTVHLDVFGLDGASCTVAVNVNGYGCFFFASNGSFNPNNSIPTPYDVSTATYNSMNPTFPTTRAFPIAGSAPGEFYFVDSPTTPYNIIATYSTVTQELVFISGGTNVVVSTFSGAEEVGLITNVVKDIVQRFSFVLENLFGDDRFELTTNQKDNTFLQPSANYDSKLDQIVQILNASTLTFTPRIILNGAFVGKLSASVTGPDQPTVEQDTDYKIFRSTTAKIEDYLPPTVGSVNETLYPKLRYSFGSVDYGTDFLEINIFSFVSPLRSRLDKRLLGPNLNGTGTPSDPNDPFDYRDYNTFNLPRYNTKLLPNTWFGANPSTDAYLLVNESLVFNSTTNPKLASYNQLLSALRCFGVLEALAYKINVRAALQGPSIATNVASNLLAMRNATVCETIKSGGIPTNSPVYLTDAIYNDLKWYTSSADQALY